MDNIFSIQSLWELSVAIATRVLIQSASKPIAGNAPPHSTMMLHLKFDYDRPTGLRDIHL